MNELGVQMSTTESRVSRQGNSALAFFKTMRVHQWTKNLIVYAGLVFDGQLFNVSLFFEVTIVFLAFCFVSSAVYVFNDIVDIEEDRLHPRKKKRPLPSGEIRPGTATAGAVALLVGGMALGWAIDPRVALILTIYLAQNIAYSLYLKRFVLIDVMILSLGFLLRVYAGVIVVDSQTFSPWLFICVTLLALFLGFGKRRHELVILNDDAKKHRASLGEYNLVLLDQIIGLLTTSTFIAYTLYTFEASTVTVTDNRMMITVPFVFYFICRYLYLIHVKKLGGAPDELLFNDRPLLLNSMAWVITAVALLYFIP